MKLDLSKDEAMFLKEQLARRISDLEDELVHTDARDLQSALAGDARRLGAIGHRLDRLLDADDVAA